MIRELQIKHSEWASRNFPNAVSDDALIGIVEEVGELAHAHLKAKQCIRGTPEQHRLDKMDAIGDIFMYMLHYCTLEGIDAEMTIVDTWYTISQRDWLKNKENGVTT